MRRKLLEGLQISREFWQTVEDRKDNLTDTSPTYWFGTHRANEHILLQWSKALISKHKENLLVDDNTLNLSAAITFPQNCEELQEKIYVVLQTCSSAPARATEIGILRVRNNSIGARNIFFFAGRLFTVVTYHKGSNMNEGPSCPIARFPDRVTAGILIVYIMVIRPLEVAVTQALQANIHGRIEEEHTNMDEGAWGENQRDYLFVSRGNPVTIERLRYSFQKVMKKAGIPLSISQHRQFQSGMVKNFLDSEEICAIDGKFFLHDQAGHSEQTAHNLYAVSTADMRKLTATELEYFCNTSMTWHAALGLSHGSPSSLEDKLSDSSKRSVSETLCHPKYHPRHGSEAEFAEQFLRGQELLLSNLKAGGEMKPRSR